MASNQDIDFLNKQLGGMTGAPMANSYSDPQNNVTAPGFGRIEWRQGMPMPGSAGIGSSSVMTSTNPGSPNAPLPPVTPNPANATPLSFQADTNAGLDALAGRYNKQLDNIENNTGRIMDQRAGRLRDIREGGANALQQSMTQAGKASDPAQSAYAAETAAGEQRAVTDVGQEQQNALTSALQGGVAVNRAPSDLALDEKRFQLSAYSADKAAQNQDAQTNLQALQALLNAQRSSPIYSGADATAAPSGYAGYGGGGLGAVQLDPVRYAR